MHSEGKNAYTYQIDDEGWSLSGELGMPELYAHGATQPLLQKHKTAGTMDDVKSGNWACPDLAPIQYTTKITKALHYSGGTG